MTFIMMDDQSVINSVTALPLLFFLLILITFVLIEGSVQMSSQMRVGNKLGKFRNSMYCNPENPCLCRVQL